MNVAADGGVDNISYMSSREVPGHRRGCIPTVALTVVYCRGPNYVLVFDAMKLLSKKGFQVRLLEDGFTEWAQPALPVVFTQ